MLNRMYELAQQSANGTYTEAESGFSDRNQLQKEVKALSDEIDRIAKNSNFNGIQLLDGTYAEKNLTLQIGDSAGETLDINIAKMTTDDDALGVKAGDDGVNISTQTGAQAAIAKIKTAINTVSDTRGGLGALQNRLEHTINNLSVTQENMQDAESTIRDTDVAAEMMKYTKNSILVQSAQAMLAQANQQPQGVLQLLQ